MSGRAFLDICAGETRFVRTDAHGRPVELLFERPSDEGRVARYGETYLGRVASIEPSLSGAFVDLGVGRPGVLPFKDKRPHAGLTEGAAVRVEIAAEAAPGKGPRLRRLPDGDEDGPAPRRLSAAPPLAERAPDAERGPAARSAADLAVEIAGSREVAFAGGGGLAIEPTRGLIAIDVDGGARGADEVNPAAAGEAARQIALRSLSGLIVIDFAGAPSRAAGTELRTAVLSRLSDAGLKADAALLSRFGVLELAVERRRRAAHEILIGPDGEPSIETAALNALRALEREGGADRGAQLALNVAEPVAAWLGAHEAIWRPTLTERLGARFTVAAAPGAPCAYIDVSTAS